MSDSPYSRFVCIVSRGGEHVGWVAVDSAVAGRARGGLRMVREADEQQFSVLARSMTLKYGYLGLPQGGAKAGVRGDPDWPPARRRQALAEFAAAIAPLLRRRVYTPDPDLGVDSADIHAMLSSIGLAPLHRERRGAHSGYYTALTVFVAATVALRRRQPGAARGSAAIEGFGKVGAPLARLLAAAGWKIVAVSTSRGAIHDERGLDVARLENLATRFRSELVDHYPRAARLDRAEIIEVPADVFFPCAIQNSIGIEDAGLVKARLICAGANAPLAEGADAALIERDVLALPDFVTNLGGVLGGTMEYAGWSRHEIRAFIQREFAGSVDRLLGDAARLQVSPTALAKQRALDRAARVRKRASHPSTGDSTLQIALAFYRRGCIPKRLVARISRSYFVRAVQPSVGGARA